MVLTALHAQLQNTRGARTLRPVQNVQLEIFPPLKVLQSLTVNVMLDGQGTISSITCVYVVLLESTRQYWEMMNAQGVMVASTPLW